MKTNKKFILGVVALSLLITSFSVKADCTDPILVNDTEYGTLYKINTATYYQTCDQASKSFLCDGFDFVGVDVENYTYGKCEDTQWRQCEDIWDTTNNNYKDHLTPKIGYKISSASSAAICNQNRVNLECIDGTWSGGNQEDLFPNCEVQGTDCSFTGLDNTKVDIANGNGKYLFYTPISVYPTTCQQSSGYVSCKDGVLAGNPGFFGYTTCSDGTTQTCYFTGKDATGKDKQFVIANANSVKFYKDYVSTYPETCKDIEGEISCDNGKTIGDYSTYKASYCYDGSVKDCTFTGVDSRGQDKSIVIRNLEKKTFYLQGDAPDGTLCNSSEVACDNGILKGSFATHKYESCINNCVFDNNNFSNITFINHFSGSNINTGFDIFSTLQAKYPDSCEKNKSILSCDNGRVIGDYSIYKYDTCEQIGGLSDGVDLILNISAQGGAGTEDDPIQIAQFSSPSINMSLKNRGKAIVSGSNIQAGFLTCEWIDAGTNSLNIYKSRQIISLVINPGTSYKKAITFNDIFTQSLGVKNVKCILDSKKNRGKAGIDINAENNIWLGTFDVVTAERFDISMNRAIDSIKDNLDSPEIKLGAGGINEFIITKVMNVLVPLIIVLGILISILGFYKILFSDDDKAIGEGVKYVTYGVVGIIVIMSAKFITTTIYSDIFQEGMLGYGSIQGYDMAQKIYNNLAFPFIKLAIYLSLGVLFVIMASRVMTFIFGSDDDTKKKAGTIIAWNSIGMLVIIAAKQVVEFIYGKQETVVKAVSNLGEIGSGILADKNLPILYQVINRAMGLASLVILVMILIEAFKLLTKPDSPDTMKGIKNTLLYIVIGIIIIGTGYIITNFLIIN